MNNDKIATVLAFASGIAIGINWPKIKGYVAPRIKKLGVITYGYPSTAVDYLAKKAKDFKGMVLKPKKKKEPIKKESTKRVAEEKKAGKKAASAAITPA